MKKSLIHTPLPAHIAHGLSNNLRPKKKVLAILLNHLALLQQQLSVVQKPMLRAIMGLTITQLAVASMSIIPLLPA